MSRPHVSFEVQHFERIDAAPGTVLLRLQGTWRSSRREHLSTPALVLDDGQTTRRLPPLRGPDDTTPQPTPGGTLWRGAFRVPAGLLSGHVTYTLDAGADVLVDLPRPQVRQASATAAALEQRIVELEALAATADAAAQARIAELQAAVGLLREDRDALTATHADLVKRHRLLTGEHERITEVLQRVSTRHQALVNRHEELVAGRGQPSGEREQRHRVPEPTSGEVILRRQPPPRDAERTAATVARTRRRTARRPPARLMPSERTVAIALMLLAVSAGLILLVGLVGVVVRG